MTGPHRLLLDLAGTLAARAVVAYRTEVARLDPPAKPGRGEQNCTACSTERTWSRVVDVPARATATVLDGAGFTARVRDP